MEIKGEKINLRELKDSDAESIRFHAKDIEVAKEVPLPYPYTLKHAKDFIKLTKKHWITKEEHQFGIEDPETKKIIGMVGLFNFDKKVKKAETGYWLGKKYWRQGITKEALLLICNYGFKKLKLRKIYADVRPNNKPSQKLLEKCKFKLEGRLRKELKEGRKWVDNLVYGILKEEYTKHYK